MNLANIKLVDLHNDAIVEMPAKSFKRYIAKAQKSGVRAILMSVYTTEMPEPIKQIKEYKQIIDDTNAVSKKTELLLHIEDAWFVTEQNIDELIALKPYSVGLTWNADNALAGGAFDDGHLTSLGKLVIEKLVANGIQVDLAHLNKQSFYAVAEVLTEKKQKLLCTHACFSPVNLHSRNLTAKQIRTIVDSGGLVGMTFVGDFLTTKKHVTLEHVYSHIKYFIDNFGDDNLAIGTDFFGTEKLPHLLESYKGFPRLKKFLEKKGIAKDTLEKVFVSNAMSFLEK